MIIPGADQALKNLVTWSERKEWKPLCTKVLEEHFAEARRMLGVDGGALTGKLGDEFFTLAVGCALEDFCTRAFGDDRLNVIEDYLKRRGWREAVPGRRYLLALRASVMSLYEVVELDPGKHLVLRDVFRGGEPITVLDRRGSQTASVGDYMGARILVVNGKHYMSGGVLTFPGEVADMLEKTFQQSVGAIKENTPDGDNVEAISAEQWRQVVLQRSAAVFTQTWLAIIIRVVSEGRA